MHSYKGYHLHYFKVKEQRMKERDGGERERERMAKQLHSSGT